MLLIEVTCTATRCPGLKLHSHPKMQGTTVFQCMQTLYLSRESFAELLQDSPGLGRNTWTQNLPPHSSAEDSHTLQRFPCQPVGSVRPHLRLQLHTAGGGSGPEALQHQWQIECKFHVFGN